MLKKLSMFNYVVEVPSESIEKFTEIMKELQPELEKLNECTPGETWKVVTEDSMKYYKFVGFVGGVATSCITYLIARKSHFNV